MHSAHNYDHADHARPNGFTLEAYQNVFRDNRVWSGYKNSLIYTICGTLLNLCLTIPTAYAWSKKDLFGRSTLAVFLLIPMYFGGGLMPTYLQIKSLGLINKPCSTAAIVDQLRIRLSVFPQR